MAATNGLQPPLSKRVITALERALTPVRPGADHEQPLPSLCDHLVLLLLAAQVAQPYVIRLMFARQRRARSRRAETCRRSSGRLSTCSNEFRRRWSRSWGSRTAQDCQTTSERAVAGCSPGPGSSGMRPAISSPIITLSPAQATRSCGSPPATSSRQTSSAPLPITISR